LELSSDESSEESSSDEEFSTDEEEEFRVWADNRRLSMDSGVSF
jgi:hypothetical protein